MTEPHTEEDWQSYLMPGTDTLRTRPGLSDPIAAALFERITSADAETTLRTTTDRPRTFDLAHLRDIHGRLFGDVYDWAGQLRYVDIQKPGQTGEPFLHHTWIRTHTSATVDQLRADGNLTQCSDPGVWADRAAQYWAAMLHAHPFREGNGRAIRIWIEDLAAAAGHTLDWQRGTAERNVYASIAATNGDLEPMRALLTQIAGGSLGVDRPIDALDDQYKLHHAQAWARTGLAAGDDDYLTAYVQRFTAQLDEVRHYLDGQLVRAASSEQPAETRWRGLAASIHPGLVAADDWHQFAGELDAAAGEGMDVPSVLHRIGQTRHTVAHVRPEPVASSQDAPTLSSSHRQPEPPQHREMAAAGYYRDTSPPASGPRR